MVGIDKNAPEALFKVPCRMCDKLFARKSLGGHLHIHNTDKFQCTKAAYVKKFGPSAENDFWIYNKTPEQREATRRENRQRVLDMGRRTVQSSMDTLLQANLEGLSEEEQVYFDTTSAHLFQQVDRDESQRAAVASLVFDQIILNRLRSRQLMNKKDMVLDKDFESVVTATETRINKAMTALGVSREAQIKRGAAVTSSIASIISGYFDEVERTKLETLDAWRLEEERVLAKMCDRLERFIMPEAPDLEDEEVADGDETGNPLSLEDALSRAGIAAGGNLKKTTAGTKQSIHDDEDEAE